MQSSAVAMSRDYLRRSAWPALLTLLYLVGFPWLGYCLMQWHGVRPPPEAFRDQPLPFSILVVCLFGFLLVVWVGQENRFGVGPRLYVLPIATWFLVACRMLQGALTTAVLFVITVAACNQIFGTAWPLAGPALALAVVALWTQAYAWSLLHFRLWRFVAVLAVIASLGYWIAARFHPDGFYSPAQPWASPTAGEFLTLCGYALAAFGVGVQCVAQHRRGDCEGIADWLTRIERRWDAVFVHRERQFQSAQEALFWMEWTRRGMALPATMACLLLMAPLAGGVGVALGWTRPIDVLEVELFMALAVYPQIAFLVGLFLGHRNTNSSRVEYDTFSATRPVTDVALSAAFLRSAGLAVACSYGLSLAFSLATAGWVAWQERAGALLSLQQYIPLVESPLGWWSILVVLVASVLTTWAALGLGATIVLAGRMPLVGWAIGVPVVGLVAWLITMDFLVPPSVAMVLNALGAGLFGLACMSGTVWAFARALSRGLTCSRSAWLSAIAWVALCGLAVLILSVAPPPNPPMPGLRWLALPLIPGLLALVFAPLATAPLALAWNRHS